MSNTHARNYMSTITIVVFGYQCRDSNTDDNNSYTMSYYLPATILLQFKEMMFQVDLPPNTSLKYLA